MEAAKREGKVVFYSSNQRDAVQASADLFQKKYGIPVEWQRKVAGELMAQIETERRAGKIQADVIEMSSLNVLSNQGLLQAFEPPNLSKVPAAFRDKGNVNHPRVLLPGVMLYNTDRVKADQVPKSFNDLTDPKWKKRLGMAVPKTSVATAGFIQLLIEKYGWGFVEGLAKNQPLMQPSVQTLPGLLMSGEIDVAISSDSTFFEAKARGEPIGLIFGSDLVPATVVRIGVAKDSARPNAAKSFVDFLLSEEGQQGAVVDHGLNGIVPGLKPKPGAKPIDLAAVKEVDQDKLAAELEALSKKFDQIIQAAR